MSARSVSKEQLDARFHRLWARIGFVSSGGGGTGPQGPQGTQGATGSQGAQGGAGVQGAAGAAGAQGSQGSSGVQGPQGSGGSQGSQGATGVQGPQGSQGFTGLQGPQGAQGPQGFTGAQGTTGAQGPQGPQGPQGAVGPKPAFVALASGGTHTVAGGADEIIFVDASVPATVETINLPAAGVATNDQTVEVVLLSGAPGASPTFNPQVVVNAGANNQIASFGVLGQPGALLAALGAPPGQPQTITAPGAIVTLRYRASGSQPGPATLGVWLPTD